MIDSLLDALSNSALSIAIAEDPVAFPWIEVVHVMAITIVFGSILLVDMRLMGLAARDFPISRLSRAIVPLTWVAFIIAAISGALLFASNPNTYYANFAFRAKILALICAGINMAIFHVWTMRNMRQWDEARAIPLGVRAAGLISIILWVAVIAFGRWIGFTMSPF
jgi:hypothetical protein